MKDTKVLALVTKAKNQNKKAFAKLCELKVNEVIFLCVREMGNQQDGQDAAQEVFIQMQKSIPRLQSPEAFNVWLNRLVHNTCNTMKRKTVRNRSMLDTEESFEDFLMDEALVSLQDALEQEESRKHIIAVIDSLPDKYRCCVVMHYYQNLSYAQIAEVLGISTDAVNNNMRMARKYIKRQLGADEAGRDVAAMSAFAVGPLLTTTMAEAAKTAVSAVAAKQCLVGAGVYSAFAVGAAGAGFAGGLLAKGVAAVAGVALAAAAGTGVYTVTHSSSQQSPPVPEAATVAAYDGGQAGDALYSLPAGALVAQTDNALGGRITLKPDENADPQALRGLDGVGLELVAANDTATVLASVTVQGGVADGAFLFEGIANGRYKLRVVLPAGAQVTDESPAGLASGLLESGSWLAWDGKSEFDLVDGQTRFTGLDLEVELPTRLSGHVTMYVDGGAIEFEDGILPGIYMELYDPQGCLLASVPVGESGEYLFENPMISQTGRYTLHLASDENALWALDIPDEPIDLWPGIMA